VKIRLTKSLDGNTCLGFSFSGIKKGGAGSVAFFVFVARLGGYAVRLTVSCE
jgi:hypothetical protein